MGARKLSGGIEKNELLDLKGYLKRKKSLLRLRFSGNRGRLTFKGPRLRSRYKKRLEIEIPVDYKKARAIFQFLGFRPAVSYTKKREEYRLGGCLVSLDYLAKQGWFLEIEGAPGSIRKLIRGLKLQQQDQEPRSYPQLLGLK